MDGIEERLDFDPAEHPDSAEAPPPDSDLGGDPMLDEANVDDSLIPQVTDDAPILEDS